MANIAEDEEEMKIQYGKTVYRDFASMMNSIITETPCNLTEETILQEKVMMMGYANDYVFPDEISDTNKLKCILDTPEIVPSVSCYPNSVILEIRNFFNQQNPTQTIKNADDDIIGILRQLKTFLGYREDKLLSVFPKKKQMLYIYRYFKPAKCMADFEGPYHEGLEFEETIYGQYHAPTRRLEKKYPNYIDIDYTITFKHEKYVNARFRTFELRYNDKHTQAFKNECVTIMQDDESMFSIHYTFSHIYLIILLQYFLKVQHVTQISISLSYEGHAQAIYINKSGTGHYMFYNSNCQNDIYSHNALIEKDVLTLLRFTYPDIRIYQNGRHQYEMPLCKDFAYTFIESMLDPTKTLEEKFSRAQHAEDRDKCIKDCHFDNLNRYVNYLFVPFIYNQKIDDNSNIVQYLLDKANEYN